MALLTEYSCRATPGRRVVEVYDADAYLGGEDALAAARSQVVAGDGYHLYLRSLQPHIDVEVTIRIWDGSPPAAPEDAEGDISGAQEVRREPMCRRPARPCSGRFDRLCAAVAAPSAPSSVTVVKDASGRYFASFVVDVEPAALPPGTRPGSDRSSAARSRA